MYAGLANKDVMKKLLLCILPSVILCASCAKEKAVESRVQVSVSTSVPGTKGAGELTIASLRTSSFGLFGYYRDAGYFFDGVDETRRLMDNARMSFVESGAGGDRWVCDPTVYWPLGCTMTFFAYAPYMDNAGSILTLPNADGNAMLRGTYVVPSDPKEQPDFCLSAPVLDWKASQGDVPIAFGHALSKVLFYFNADGDLYEDEQHRFAVKSILIEGLVGNNSFTFGGEDGFRWDTAPRHDMATRTASYSLSVGAGTLTGRMMPFVSEVAEEEGLDRYLCVNGLPDGILYLLPQPLTAAARLTVEYGAYLYDDVLGEWIEDLAVPTKPMTVSLPETTVWNAGRTICYSATIDVTYYVDLELSVTLADWEGNALDDIEFEHE